MNARRFLRCSIASTAAAPSAHPESSGNGSSSRFAWTKVSSRGETVISHRFTPSYESILVEHKGVDVTRSAVNIEPLAGRGSEMAERVSDHLTDHGFALTAAAKRPT